jgi:hypothetical protein
MSTKRGYFVLLGVLAVTAIALRVGLGLNLGVSTLVLFVGWPLVGTLVILDDDFRGGWSNPDGTVTPVWKTLPFWADILLCRGAVVLVAFAIESREDTHLLIELLGAAIIMLVIGIPVLLKAHRSNASASR